MPDEAVITQERFPEDVIKILTQPIDPQAIVAPGTGTRGLSSIKNIYITERLNEAFGFGRWQYTDEVITVTEARTETRRKNNQEYEVVIMPMVVLKVHLLLLDYPWFCGWSYGGNDNADLGDAHKGAISDALSKICAVHFHIAIDVYKGNPPERGPQKTKEQIQAEAKAKVEVIKAQMPPKPDLTAQLEASLEQTPDVSAEEDAPGENDCFDPEKCISKKQAGLFWVNATKNHSAEDVKTGTELQGIVQHLQVPQRTTDDL